MTISSSTRICNAAATWLSSAVADEALFRFLHSLGPSGDFFFKGFKITAVNAGSAAVRRRVGSELERNAVFRGQFLAWPTAPWASWREAVAILDEGWLKRNWRALVSSAGGRLALVALATDRRESMVRRGLRVMARPGFWNRADGEAEAKAAAPPGWSALSALAAPGVGGAAVAAPHPNPERARRQDEVRRQVENRAREHVDKWRRRSIEAGEALKSEREAWQQERRQLRRDAREALDLAERLRGDMEASVAARVGAFRVDALGVTPEIVRIQEFVHAHPAHDLAERAERVLAAQRQMNEAHGTLDELRAEIAGLQDLEQRLSRCIRESIVVLPELGELLGDVGRRLDEAGAMLRAADAGDSAMDAPPPVVCGLLASIRRAVGADSAAALGQVEAVLAIDVVRKALPERWVGRLEQEIAARRRLLAENTCETGWTPPPMPAPPASSEKPGTRDIWDVSAALRRLGDAAAGVLVVVDGYNVLKGVEPFASIERLSGLAPARTRLMDRCRERSRGGVHIEVVFDGTGAVGTHEQDGNLAVIFSARTQESQNADDIIVERVGTRAATGDGAIWVVTADSGLRQRLRGVAVDFVAPADFVRYLDA